MIAGRRLNAMRLPPRACGSSLLVAVALLIACSPGVAQEEFDAAQQVLDREQARTRELESRLGLEERNQVALLARLDQAEIRIAELDSERMKAEAQKSQLESKLEANVETSDELRSEVDEAQALQALLETLLAWNRKDEKTFSAGYTEGGAANTVLALPRAVGEPGLSLRRLVDVSAAGEEATIHVMFALGRQRNSVNIAMVKEQGEWKIDGERRLPPKIKEGTATVNVTVADCKLAFDKTSVSDGNVGFKLTNLGAQQHHLVLYEGSDLQSSQLAFVMDLEPGSEMNVAFAQPLAPGTYLFQCLSAGQVDSRVSLADAQGTLAEFTVR